VEKGGLRVVTTLDLKLQEQAQKIVSSYAPSLKQLNVNNAATLITDPKTGEILSMIGSFDYFDTSNNGNFNIATAFRQPGSSIKVVNYAAALKTPYFTAASILDDSPITYKTAGQIPYSPVNYDGAYHGKVTFRTALASSYNIPAVKMMALNTVETMVASASAFGITTFKDPSMYGLSLTLGGGEVTMLDMAKAFGVFANSGERKDLVSILKVEDKNGKVLTEFKDANFVTEINKPLAYPSSLLMGGTKVLSPQTAYLISHILLDNNARQPMFGASSFLVVPGRTVSVKTGTTNDKRDNWTIGYTPNFLTVVWVGNNDNSPMHPYLTSGVTGAAPIWHKIMKEVLKNQTDLWPKQPEGIVGASICPLSGKAPPSPDSSSQDKGCLGNPRFEYFLKDTVPKEPEVLKRQVAIDKATGKLALPTQKDNIEMQEKNVVEDPFGLYCLNCPHDKNDPLEIVKY
jgi:membrane peptidoglycan carboxypeptidase